MHTEGAVNHESDVKHVLDGRVPALGIDLGGTKIAAAMSDGKSLVSDVVSLNTGSSSEEILNQLVGIIEDFQKTNVFAGVGLCTAGVVHPGSGDVIGSAPNIPGWEGTQVRRILESRTMVRVHIENDANAAAYAEWKVGNFGEAPCMVFITLGTGVGGGIILNGAIHRGMNYAAGEVGHFRITMENKRICSCGLFDCWEEYGSGRGMVATAKELLQGVTEEQCNLAGKIGNITTRDIVSAAETGDIIATRVIEKWHEHICAGLAVIGPILNPSAFVLGGGLCEFVNLETLTELFKEKTIKDVYTGIIITKSQLGKYAGLIGAANLVLGEIAVESTKLS
jgi:glucokinase